MGFILSQVSNLQNETNKRNTKLKTLLEIRSNAPFICYLQNIKHASEDSVYIFFIKALWLSNVESHSVERQNVWKVQQCQCTSQLTIIYLMQRSGRPSATSPTTSLRWQDGPTLSGERPVAGNSGLLEHRHEKPLDVGW